MPKIDKDKMKCNKPRRQKSGGKKFVVKACDKGKEKIVRFGDANMRIRKSNPKARASFRARHGCDKGTLDKLKAKYWSCRMWSTVVFGILIANQFGEKDVSVEILQALL